MVAKISLGTVILFTLLFIRCGTNNNETKSNTAEEIIDTLKSKSDTVADLESENGYRLPSALQIAYVSKKSGTTYNASWLNNTKQVTKYNTSNYKRATNFGIYSSDLANCLFNKKYSESKEYLKALTEMGSYLGLNQAFESDNLGKRFDANISNEDSLVKLVSNIQLKTDILFEQNKQKHIIVIAFAGAWIESLNLANESYLKEKNKKVLNGFCEQILFASTLIKALEVNSYKETEIAELLENIKNINNTFKAIPSVKSIFEKDADLDFTSLQLSDAELATVTNLIKDLRTKMLVFTRAFIIYTEWNHKRSR